MNYEDWPEVDDYPKLPLLKQNKNLSGLKFGQLTAMYITPDKAERKNNKKRTIWLCQCACGNYTTKISSNLTSGNNHSCGCTRRKDYHHPGEKFGRLTLTGRDGKNSKICLCKCDCGKEISVYSSNLFSKKIQSCGCLYNDSRIKDITGKRFGMLTAIKLIPEKRKSRGAIWLCRCDCGNEKEISEKNLVSGLYSCGCSVESKGERIIGNILKDNHINYISQKTFSKCRNPLTNRLFKFDFYLPEYNCCIEFDGEQHFKPIKYFGGKEDYNKTKTRDLYKNKWCKENNILIIRVPYLYLDTVSIEDLLPKTSKFLI